VYPAWASNDAHNKQYKDYPAGNLFKFFPPSLKILWLEIEMEQIERHDYYTSVVTAAILQHQAQNHLQRLHTMMLEEMNAGHASCTLENLTICLCEQAGQCHSARRALLSSDEVKSIKVD
jgi:hypothetical protein